MKLVAHEIAHAQLIPAQAGTQDFLNHEKHEKHERGVIAKAGCVS